MTMFDVQAEYAALAAGADIDWERLAGKTVLVTGATGLVGSLCVRFMLERNRAFGSGIQVLAMVRDRSKAEATFAGYAAEDGLSYLVADLVQPFVADVGPDFIIHAGCPTASRYFASNPVETSLAIVEGTRAMLELAKRAKAESLVYVSSMEVYGAGNHERGLELRLDESQLGYTDTMSVRSCYPEGKRMAENYCCTYAAEYGVPAKVARLAQTFGPGVPRNDARVFAQFARSAMAGEDLVLKTTGESTRMYVYTADAVTAIFTILLRGADGEAYNVANEFTYSSVVEMAHLVADEFSGGASEVVIDVDPDAPYPPEHHLPLATEKLRALGWGPRANLSSMFRNLVEYLEA